MSGAGGVACSSEAASVIELITGLLVTVRVSMATGSLASAFVILRVTVPAARTLTGVVWLSIAGMVRTIVVGLITWMLPPIPPTPDRGTALPGVPAASEPV